MTIPSTLAHTILQVQKSLQEGWNRIHHSHSLALSLASQLQLHSNFIRFNLSNMRFTAVFLVALSAATSGFALSKKGGDGKHFLISSPFSLSSTLTPLLYQLPTTTPASGPAASPAPTASSSSLSTHRQSRPSPALAPTPTCMPSP